MRPTLLRTAGCAAGLLLLAPLAAPADPGGCPTERDLRRMDAGQLRELFLESDLGTPLVGAARGRLVSLADRRGPVRTGLTNAAWKGKTAEPDGTFVNRWVGGVHAIGSRYEVGPSWLDGRPALVVEYPPGTPILGKTRDELREVAPGLYLGPLYDKTPCPVLRGWLVLRVEPGRR
ncbi:MAG: hypothetical protein K2X87_03225 [Gemmataceae bacterium]|nr:hypothetical protein [Gemmataceae bacterium]